MNLADFHFLRPWWLLILLPILLLWLSVKQNKARSNWSAVCDPHLLPYILTGKAGGKGYAGEISLFCGTLLCLMALSGPTWERLPQPVFRPQSALVILLDLSRSMDCPDITPSRLTRARYKLSDILKQRTEGQTALVAFAGDAYTVTPLTTDTNTISSLLSSLNTSIMPTQGSRVDLAIEKAVQLIKQAGHLKGDLLLIGDGFSDQRATAAAENISTEGFNLSVLAVGTKEGAPIPTESGFLQDRQGSIVIPKLNEPQLRDLALQGDGFYQRISIDDRDIDALLAGFSHKLRRNELGKSERFIDRWQDQGPWLLLPLLPLAALAFRRGVLFSLLLLLHLVNPAQALELTYLWKTQDQRAFERLENGDAVSAAKQFTDPQWRGYAQYRAGQFQESVDSLKDLNDSTSLYNRGNALAQLGNYSDAIKSYEKIPESDPIYPDAQHNKEILQLLLQSNSPADQQQQNNSTGQQNDEKSLKDKLQNNHKESTKNNSSEHAAESDQNQTQGGAENKAASKKESDTRNKLEGQAKNSEMSQAKNAESKDTRRADTLVASEVSDSSSQETEEHWLNQIPDDPGSLLQRKFLYQYRKRQSVDEENPW